MVLALLNLAMLILIGLAVATTWRVLTGPTLPDRLLAGDLTIALLTFILAVAAVKGGSEFYLDAAMVAALLAFTSTIVLVKFVARGRVFEE
ncbi:putative monovalent cation/H+ antiporter subunit F [compost metagenome]